MEAHTFIASGQPSIFSEKPQSLSPPLCMTAYRIDGKDFGVKVVSGVSKGESILAGN